MAQLAVEKEYTVFEDDKGREFFKQPQPDGSTKKVYLDEQSEPPEQDDRRPSPRQENVIIVEDKPSPRNGTDTVLLVPSNMQGRSPPPSRKKTEIILVENHPQTPQPAQPEIIYVTTEPEPVQREESQPTVFVLQEPQPPPPPPQRKMSPEVVYIQNDRPEQQKQPSQTVIMIDENDPSQGGYYTPSPRQYNSQKKQLYRSTPRSQTGAGPVSPWPRQPKKEKPQPKYQLQPKPDQPTTLVGGMLVIDNDPWEAHAKVSHTNPNYRRSGGEVVIPQDKLKWKSKPRIDANNEGYVRGGGNVPILHEHLAWDGKRRIDDRNPEYQRGGGNVVIVHENLKWRKNRKARSQPVPLTSRSLDSSGQESQMDDTLSEGVPSNDGSKATYRDYLQNKKAAPQIGGYAGQYRGKIHRYKNTDGTTPFFDLQKRKPLLKSDGDLVVMEEPKQPAPVKAKMTKRKPDQQPKPSVPWFKQKQEKQDHNGQPRQYYPSNNKPLPPIGIQNNHASAPQPRKKYVLPKDKSLPWQHKEKKLERVNTKTLEAAGKPTKKVPALLPYNSDYNARYDPYDDGYQDNNEYGNQYGQVQSDGGYRNNHKDRENLRENNKYTATHKHHHFPTRKRNEPVY